MGQDIGTNALPLLTTVYLIRWAGNESLHTVAIRSRISPSRISKMQKLIERNPLTLGQLRLFARCKVKN